MTEPAENADARAAALAERVGLSAEALVDYLDGVVAAPGWENGAWVAHLAPDADADADAGLAGALRAFCADLAEARDPGFTDGPAPAERLAALRAELARRGLDGFLVPRTDEYQNEYIPARAERLWWLTGFNGSAGLGIVGRTRAAVFSDGRYTLQLRAQIDGDLFEARHLIDEPPARWLAEAFAPGARVGYDPWLHTQAELARFKAAAEGRDIAFVAVDTNPLDAVWTAQPAAPLTPAVVHPVQYAGREAADKRDQIAREVGAAGADAVVLTAVDSIAWLLNLRGGDVAHKPLALSYAVVHADARVDWFVDTRKVGADLRAHLGNAVAVRPLDEFGAGLDALGAGRATVMVDPASAPEAVPTRLRAAGAAIKSADDPVALPKACKNPVELAGARAAHLRDGAALTRFLHWMKRVVEPGTVSELQAARKLAALRGQDPLLRDLSFESISGSGPNGAVIHYRVTPRGDRIIGAGELYLIDSGGQYPDGTTDVTRTLAIGPPHEEMRDRFTRVLKGHIAIARAIFPDGTTGSQIDALARLALWEVGLDYDHGTGHGVGSYLGVHEGPQRISKAPNRVALRPGMIVSNEPGYYKTDAYGIRIENLVAVIAMPPPPGAERTLLGFETLTLAPIDRDLIDVALLNPAERDWLNAYHARVAECIGPLVPAAVRAWLAEETRPI